MQAWQPQPTVRVAMKQKWPIRVGLHVQGKLDLEQGSHSPATEAMPEEVVSTARGWRIKSFLTGGLDGESVCPPHPWYSPCVKCSSFQFTWVIFFCSSMLQILQCNSHFFREGFPTPKCDRLLSNRFTLLSPSCNSYYTWLWLVTCFRFLLYSGNHEDRDNFCSIHFWSSMPTHSKLGT